VWRLFPGCVLYPKVFSPLLSTVFLFGARFSGPPLKSLVLFKRNNSPFFPVGFISISSTLPTILVNFLFLLLSNRGTGIRERDFGESVRPPLPAFVNFRPLLSFPHPFFPPQKIPRRDHSSSPMSRGNSDFLINPRSFHI